MRPVRSPGRPSADRNPFACEARLREWAAVDAAEQMQPLNRILAAAGIVLLVVSAALFVKGLA